MYLVDRIFSFGRDLRSESRFSPVNFFIKRASYLGSPTVEYYLYKQITAGKLEFECV